MRLRLKRSVDTPEVKAGEPGGKGTTKRRRLALLGVAGAMLLSLVMPGGFAQPERAQAHSSCYDAWQNSGHTARAHSYHCHGWATVDGDDVQTRVHICGLSGTLHGVTVRHHHVGYFGRDFWSSTDEHHDPGGEGCIKRG